jgi:uncharacterized protein (DUF1778 family)
MPTPAAIRRRDQRLEARVTPDQKELIERAACVQGRTVTDFVVVALQEAAKQAIADHIVWKLTLRHFREITRPYSSRMTH